MGVARAGGRQSVPPPRPAWEPRRALGSQTAPSPTGKVVCEEPNSRMHHFVGCLEWDGKKYPLDSGHILLRGCKIRNTDTCYGMVLYAGAAAAPAATRGSLGPGSDAGDGRVEPAPQCGWGRRAGGEGGDRRMDGRTDGRTGGWVDGQSDRRLGQRMGTNSPGFDTKIMRNCGEIHLKRTKTDRLLNRLVILVSCPEPRPWGRGMEEGRDRRPQFPFLRSVQPDPIGSSVGQ